MGIRQHLPWGKSLARVMERTGWSRQEAKEKMEASKKALNIDSATYARLALWKYDDIEEQREVYERRLKKKASVERFHEKEDAKYLAKTAEKLGVSEEEALKDMEAAKKRTGCTFKEYFIYRFYELTPKEQDQVLVIKFHMKVAKKFSFDWSLSDLLTDKEATNKYFSELIKRPWCVNTKVTADEFREIFKDIKRVIYKPVGGHRGQGVKTYRINEKNSIDDVYAKVAKRRPGVVEAYVKQHDALMELAPGSVNTVRIVSLSSFDRPATKDGKNVDIAYVSLRIGEGKAVVDNFHSGGMVANIDMETGELVTDATDQEGNVFESHPYTGVKIRGFKVPYIQEAIDMVVKTINEKRIQGYLGWDIAITEDGPELIEVNLVPGIVLLQTPYAPEHKGMKYVMEKYL